MHALQALILEKSLDLLLGFVRDSKNIETARKAVKAQINAMVKDTETKWDDEAAKIVLNFLGMSDEK
jgi:hypothetical protein